MRRIRESLRRELVELEPGGVMAYTPLMVKLEEYADDPEKGKKIAARRLPFALLCALQSAECLDDIKRVIQTYPELAPEALTCAVRLRRERHFRDWTVFESEEYRSFVANLEEIVLGAHGGPMPLRTNAQS